MANTQAAVSSGAFDYSQMIFGDEPAIDIRQWRWGSLRMKRCLTTLKNVSGSVLEVGCGAGRVLKTIHRYRPELRLHGLDISEISLARARSSVPAAAFQQGNAAQLPYDDGTFDGVVVMDLLEHVENPAGALNEIARVLKRGGVLHLHVPCEGESGSLYRFWLKRGVDLTAEAVGHLHHFKRHEVRCRLKSAGFEILREWNSMYALTQMHDVIGWKSMIQQRRNPMKTPGNRDSDGPKLSDDWTRISRKKGGFREVSGALWRWASLISPNLLFLETIGLGWQPFGAVGLCVSARIRG